MSCAGLANACRFCLRYTDDVKWKRLVRSVSIWVKLLRFHEVKEEASVDALNKVSSDR